MYPILYFCKRAHSDPNYNDNLAHEKSKKKEPASQFMLVTGNVHEIDTEIDHLITSLP
ncbi:hypothetical protein D3C81_2302480 [compost metagenome]